MTATDQLRTAARHLRSSDSANSPTPDTTSSSTPAPTGGAEASTADEPVTHHYDEAVHIVSLIKAERS